MRANRIDPKDIDLEFLKSEFQRFRSELSGVKEKLGAGATEALDQMGEYLNGSGVSSRIASLEAELDALAGKVKGYGKEGVVKLEHQVTERPIASVAIAFGIGLLAAQLFRR